MEPKYNVIFQANKQENTHEYQLARVIVRAIQCAGGKEVSEEVNVSV